MINLALGFARELLGRWGLWVLLGGIFTASQASFDTTLGDANIGPYLAYVSLWPIALLFRCGWLMQKRRAEGWPLEERLRDPRGYRAPLAEFLALLLLMIGGLLLAGLAVLVPGVQSPTGGASLFPVSLQNSADGGWEFDLGGQVPDGGQMLLTLDWSQIDPPQQALAIRNAEGAEVLATAGEILRWPLQKEEAESGKVQLFAPAGTKLRLFRPLVRLEVPQPGGSDLWLLLLRQTLFFLPLMAILLALARFGQVRASLAAWAVFFFGSLAAYHPPTRLGDAGLGWLAKVFLLLKHSLPNVEGLISSGYRFERYSGTTSTGALVVWLAVGVLALLLACKRRAAR
ncbi:MAG: hypothetical protein GY879_01030 [Planctomycetes bacterium]|nr:hypothetical protein [Planctomycetota bacterium]